MPFPALVGQEHVKQALLMLAVNPALGGLLVRGDKGTAKSTAARGIARLLPPVRVNAGCLYRCPTDTPSHWCSDCREIRPTETELHAPRFVTLPLGATEDRLLGSFDLQAVLQEGARRFQPGLLAAANQGVLYVDEVNLLEDHLVDLLLDCKASGVNLVEREGLAVSHPARFLLVGTMNPEEGQLRPQLQDRFGLCAEIATLTGREERLEIMRRTLAWEADPEAFQAEWAAEEVRLTEAIVRAREVLPRVQVDARWLDAITSLSISLEVHGHRADILMAKAVATLAALDGRTPVENEDFRAAASLVYPHRLRRTPFDDEEACRRSFDSRVEEALSTATPPASAKKK